MIKIKDLLDMIDKFENKEIEEEEFRKYFNENVEVKNYLPISQKRELFNNVFSYIKENNSIGDIAQQSLMIEAMFKLHTVFAYTNLGKPKVLDEVLYNKIARTGLLEFILTNIGYDYIELKDSFNRMYIYSSLIAVNELVNPEIIQKMAEMTNNITGALKDGKGLETLKKLTGVK